MPMMEPGPELGQRAITVQHPPRLLTQRKVIYVKKQILEPKLINGMREISVPFVSHETYIRREPSIIYVKQTIKQPKVSWKTIKISEPEVKCSSKVVSEPKEVCQAILCQPVPQVVDVPKPMEYCCYSIGPATLNCKPASQYTCPPCPPAVPSGPRMPFYPPCPPCPPYCQPNPGMRPMY